MTTLDVLISKIVGFEKPMPFVFNPWLDEDPMDVQPGVGAAGRVRRLRQHFDCPSPRLLLIGEAPGYAGCHYAGVPFTNERLLMMGMVPRVVMPAGTQMRLTTRRLPWSEPSATIMWSLLHEIAMAEHTVMWNAFPYHPYGKDDGVLSNRAPTQRELERTRPILLAVLEHFRAATVIAVGRVADKALRRLGVAATAVVRHPSMGGATEFRSQMQTFARLPF